MFTTARVFIAVYAIRLASMANDANAESPFRDRILGSWTIDSYLHNGVKDTELVGHQIEFRENATAQWFHPEFGRWIGKYKIDQRKDGINHLDLQWEDDSNVNWIGIAKIEAERLHICFKSDVNERPNTFEGKNGEDLTVIVLHRGR